MKLTDTQYDLVAAYIKGELKGEVLKNFEETLAENEALQEEVLFQKSILSSLGLDMVESNLKQARIDNVLDNKTEHPHFEAIQNNIRKARIANADQQGQSRRWLAGLVAAACVLLVSTVGWRTYLDRQLTNDMNEVAHSINLEIISLNMDGIKLVSGRPDFIKYKLGEAQTAFENKDWDAALSVFDQLSRQSRYESVAMDFARGIIFYHKKEYEKSITQLKDIDMSRAVSTCEIQYFLALSYLKNKNKIKAKEEYKTLTESSKNCDRQYVEHLGKYFIL